MNNVVEVKGEVLSSIRLFVRKKFGQSELDHWLEVLSPEAKKVYSSPIQTNEWFPIREMVIEPTSYLCDMFYNKSLMGAWECGRFSAEYGLKGIKIVLAKILTPQILITKGSGLLSSYYRPSTLEVVEDSKNMVILHITDFADIDKIIEYRIAGWIQSSGEISGARDVEVKITKSLTQGDLYTEYFATWK
jgi:hypothetical protein